MVQLFFFEILLMVQHLKNKTRPCIICIYWATKNNIKFSKTENDMLNEIHNEFTHLYIYFSQNSHRLRNAVNTNCAVSLALKFSIRKAFSHCFLRLGSLGNR